MQVADAVARALYDGFLFDQAIQIEKKRHLDGVTEEERRLLESGLARKGIVGGFQLIKIRLTLLRNMHRANAAEERLGTLSL